MKARLLRRPFPSYEVVLFHNVLNEPIACISYVDFLNVAADIEQQKLEFEQEDKSHPKPKRKKP